MSVAVRQAVWHSLSRPAGPLPRRLPCARQVAARCSASFDEWLAANRLPGYRSASSGSGEGSAAPAGTAAARAEQQLAVRRFHASEAPAIAGACLQRYSYYEWRLEAPGVLVATSSSSSSGGTGLAAARLELPRLLEGAHPALFVSNEERDASPLSIRPAEQQEQLLAALSSLAAQHQQQQQQAAAAGEEQPGPSSPSPLCTLGSQLLVLLSADSAALALYADGQLRRHKVLTGYTVRRQQGKAQAAYARQGGGARSVGGAIRARETRRLFQEAAATLAAWRADIESCSLLFRSGTVRVWNDLYAAASPPPPVDRRDARWRPVGLGVRRPRLADVERVHVALSHGTLQERLQQDASSALPCKHCSI